MIRLLGKILRAIIRESLDFLAVRFLGESERTFFPLTSTRRLNRWLMELGQPHLTLNRDLLNGSDEDVLKYAIVLRQQHRPFRELFGQPQHSQWDTIELQASLPKQLSSEDGVRIANILHATPGENAHRLWELMEQLRTSFPMGICPPGRGDFLRWVIQQPEPPLGVTWPQCLWFLMEMDQRPDRGLALLYLLQPQWQAAVPDALTPFGWIRLKEYLVSRYRLQCRWLKEAQLPEELPQTRLGTPGVNIVGHLDYASGLQQAALGICQALQTVNVRLAKRDLPVGFRENPSLPRNVSPEVHDTTIYIAAMDSFPKDWYRRAGLWMRPGVRRIAVWYWEMEQIPSEWRPKLDWPQEIWAPTQFIAKAVRPHVPGEVVPMLPGLAIPEFPKLPRSHFGCHEDRFQFLFSFDMASTLERKNPIGVIRAFRQAFAKTDPVELVIKVSRGQHSPADYAKLQAECDEPNILLFDQTLPRLEWLAMLNNCDSYVSLHRSEGLGLGMAEAMHLGKPVIGTNYSGNLDFMNSHNSYLVNYQLTEVTETVGSYPAGATWAEPDLVHAAELLQHVWQHPEETQTKARLAQKEIQEQMSLVKFTNRMLVRLGFRSILE